MTANLDQLTPAQLRRVDALLAEKVMGREVAWCCGEPIPKEYEDNPIWYTSDRPEGYLAEVVPHYTTDPAAAAELLRVLAAKDMPSHVFIHENYTAVTIFHEYPTDRDVLIYNL